MYLHVFIFFPEVKMLLIIFFIMPSSTNAVQDYFNHYKNVHIESGIFIERFDLNGDTYGQFHCIERCRQNSRCMMVAHETSTGSVCILWRFNQTMDFVPLHDETSTLYTRRNSKLSIHLISYGLRIICKKNYRMHEF